MDIVMNMTPVDLKQLTGTKNANAKDGTNNNKSENDFAKALYLETDKSKMDTESNGKMDDNIQLMAAMSTMVSPVMINMVPANTEFNSLSVTNTESSETQVELPNVVPVASKAELPNVVPVAFKAELPNVVPAVSKAELPNVVPVASKAELPNVVPVASKAELPNVVPVASKAELPNVVPAASKAELPNVVPVASKAELPNVVPVASKAELPNVVPVASKAELPNVVPVASKAELPNVVPAASKAELPNVVPVASKAELPNVVPVASKAELPNVVPVASKAELPNVVPVASKAELPNVVPVASKAELPNVVPVASKAELPNVVPVASKIELPNVVPVASKVELPNVVPVEELPDALQGQLTTTVGTLQNQLVAFATKIPEVAVGGNKLSDFAQFTNQMQLQPQSKLITDQMNATETSQQETDVSTKNPMMSELLVSSIPSGLNDGLGKNNAKQSDNKKVAIDQVNTEVLQNLNNVQFIDREEVKPVLVSQISVTTDALTGDKKESSEGIIPNLTTKNTDVFASLLTQQGLKIESQGITEVKQVPVQVAADPYGVSSQIVDQVRLVAGNKNTEMIIQLKPEHLGELTFKVSVEKGIVSASFHSNNSEVRSVIESSLAQLKQEFLSQGLKVDTVGVYSGLGQFFSNGQQSGGQQQPAMKMHNKKHQEDFLDALESIDATNQGKDGMGVDYRI